ncbi:hypothetical protein BC629DRAFT_1599919 [Irpex lacteus]|nr:hypothetical protein BC629DRAFT_1599919 [Irpex lacteus]
MHTLRSLTSLKSVTVCNHGLTVKEHLPFPIDNILVYTLPSSPKSKSSTIPGATLHGPSAFNAPWNRHAKPNNFVPAELEYLCLRDIEHSPAEVKCAPYLPTLPRLRTLKLAMYSHNETPFVSSGTVPALRNLELYRDIFDSTQRELMRVVAVDDVCLPRLERLFLVGRAAESVLFRNWAQNSELFSKLRHLAIGLLRLDEHALIAEWHLPRHLETLEVVVWHKPVVKAASPGAEEAEAELEKMGDADGVLKALHACLHRNRQSKSFKTLVIRATDTLPRALFSVALNELRGLCASHGFDFQLHEGDIQGWIETRLSEGAA